MQRLRSLLLMTLALASCATGPSAVPPIPKVAAPPVASVPAPSAVEPPPGSARFIDRIPPDLSPELAEQLGFLADVCAVALHYQTDGAHRISVGCRTCPPFADGATADGKIEVDGASFFQLEAYARGHFTSPGADQRIAVFNGCESHAENWGGTLLAEREGERFHARRYISGLHPQTCKIYQRADARDVAVCEFSDAHQSISSDTLAVLDFASDPPDQKTLLSFSNEDLCLAAGGSKSSVEQLIESYDLNQNPLAKASLTVRTTRTTRTLNEQYQRYCQSRDADPPLERPYAKPQVTTLEYRYDGQTFIPNTAHSRGTLGPPGR